MHDLCRALRAAAAAALPAGAFLRRDRGDALFVTDAPRIDPRADWALSLAGAGFLCAGRDGLLRLWPDAIWLTRLEQACPDPPDDLCAGLIRFRGRAPDAESLKLFALGLRCLDGGEGAERFDRLLRRRAAVCLRQNRASPPPNADPPVGASLRRPPDAAACTARPPHPLGGGLYACALLDHELEVYLQ